MRYRIGLGTDIHKLVDCRPLVLGGVIIPYSKGEEAHSDGDVIYHALCDALLGAMGKGNIGIMFPNTDPQYENKESSYFVKEVSKLLKKEKYFIENIDICVQLEEPELNPYIEKMRKNINDLLKDFLSSTSYVSIKPGTNEGLGEIGKGEAVSATATLLLSYKC
ncbi:MAG: 2-C-methyl-D-erythritol 2,4-cyclodiphosphate synthase [Coprobacillus sp.]|nr:2-C-methyl-D-erythritol 2,4-cyclodiphosphate synthase [Coprobacillus sp.]